MIVRNKIKVLNGNSSQRFETQLKVDGKNNFVFGTRLGF